ncbi:MAG: MMPL family transporter [Capnocytophaga sp.]|nr:MMPL family transporter [Capnocytophaga sp.]
MRKLFNNFWVFVARFILRNRYFFLTIFIGITIFLAFQWKNIHITHSEANMLPEDNEISKEYGEFLKTFGEEGNLIVIGVKTEAILNPEKFNLWNALATDLQKFPQIEGVMSLNTIKELAKDTLKEAFITRDFFPKEIRSQNELDSLSHKLFTQTPVYEGLLFNENASTLRMAVSLRKDIVNTVIRKDFILKELNPLIEKYQTELETPLYVSGMPYIRTLSTEIITGEIGLFIGGALVVTCLVLLFFFRSFRAMFISICSVVIGVMWAFGFLGLFHYEITILTAVIPPLVIVIGVPNCVFLINRYQQEIQKHGYKAMALQRVITKVGNVTLLTNLTTAAGFATFIITESKILKEFGIVSSISIMCLYVISLCLIPIIYSFMPIPKDRHLKHLSKQWLGGLLDMIERIVKKHRFATFSVAVALLVASIIGIYRIHISGSIIEDMPKSETFYDDILFFEKEFGGIMPLEITVDTGRKNGVMRPATLESMAKLEDFLDNIPEISQPISVVRLVKYARQAFYNGKSEYFDLPTSQERTFLLSYIKNSGGETNMLRSIVDSTGQTARITVFMKDIGTEKMHHIEESIAQQTQKLFPEDQYTVRLTGKAYMFTKGTDYLVSNLIQSLLLTIGIIALMMFYMFRSVKMVIISLIPNMLPLLITAGVMGYVGIPLKPSTILVFGIAFGISIDDTIHFLAKYRQELVLNHWKVKRSVYAALKETGISMFYTSVVLLFGFSIFTLSSFGGTKALGGLISTTLLFAMASNLILLPSLLIALEKSIANAETLKEPNIDVLGEDE